MSIITVDARGMTCPQPVLETRKALAGGGSGVIEVLVDNEAAAENVARMARSLGCEVRLDDRGGGEIGLVLTRANGAPPEPPEVAPASSCGLPSNLAVFMAADTIGRGDDELGRLLAIAFVKTLKDLVPCPRTLLLMNSGVRLAVKGSQLAEALVDLERRGLEILVCGTCLDFFGLKAELEVGRISNMFEISSRLVAADVVIRP